MGFYLVRTLTTEIDDICMTLSDYLKSSKLFEGLYLMLQFRQRKYLPP